MNNPCFILEKEKLLKNLKYFEEIAEQTGIVWLYTLKAFHELEGLALISNSFSGFSFGNLQEYKYIRTLKSKHLHSYSPAFYEDEVLPLAKQSSTLSFNSLSQWKKYAKQTANLTSTGLRINPKLTLKQPKYCDTNNSRLGVDFKIFLDTYQNDISQFNNLEGLHFHALCHQESTAFAMLIEHIEKYYTHILKKLKWLNFGGGQNFTHYNYDTKHFIQTIQTFKAKHPHLTLYFEPGSAVVYNTGYFKCQILDIIETQTPPIVILNTSIETHLLDIAITKQKPTVQDTSSAKTKFPYRLTGMSCIAGDEIGTYYFNNALNIGDTLIFTNMLGYTLVKQTTFNSLRKVDFFVL